MTKADIIRKFKTGTMSGDDLLNLPITNKYDSGRVLLEIYYLYLDMVEGFHGDEARDIVGYTIADALAYYWEDEMEDD